MGRYSRHPNKGKVSKQAKGARKNRGLKASAVRNRNTAKVDKALRQIKDLQKNVEIQHWKSSLTGVSANSASAWTVDGINMTSGATAAGWLSNYTGGKTGVIMYTVGHMNRATTQTSPGYRYGDVAMIRSFWFKIRLTCNATTNSRIRVMLLKVKGAIADPEDLPFYDNGTTAPELETFTDKGKTSRIKKVMYDKIIKLDNFDNDGLRQVRYLNIFRRVNTKYFYGAPTKGDAGLTGDPDGLHDIAEGASSYVLVFATDTTTTSAFSIQGNLLTNYVP